MNIVSMYDLEDLLQRKVYVVRERALHWYIRDRGLQRPFHYKGRWILLDVFL
jgi:hypothetical protein